MIRIDSSKMPDVVGFLGLALLLFTGLYLTVNKSQRAMFLSGIKFRGRKMSTTKKSPRSLSPPESTTDSVDSISYHDVLPPQRRDALAEIAGNFSRGGIAKVSEEEVKSLILPMTADYRTSEGKRYTPTGFAVDDIMAIGDFPDYATLSGVPLPEPYSEFDIDRALPRPYRPFRWAYHQTMSLKKLETNWWIELENTYRERIVQRKELHAKYDKAVLDYLPGSELASKELMEMVIQFLCARYPHYFSLQANRMLRNKIFGTIQDITSKHPLEILMDNVPEDFAIMMRDEKTGLYFFRAGVLCSALGWSVATKIGLQLHQIHSPIPDYKEKMQFSMDRYFSKMPADKPIQRGSWGLEIGRPLFMPPGDPHELHRLSQDPNLRLGDCYLRVDWQTLRRLPISGAIVFNFKALFTSMLELRDEPGVPALVSKVLKEGKQSIMEYKNTWHVEHVVLPTLEKWSREQEDKGITEENWKVTTLDENPWFRGWEKKWHRQQGY